MEIKQYIKIILAFAILSTVLLSCAKDGGDDSMADRPVVVSYLVLGRPLTMSVYQQKGLLDTTTYGATIKGLTIRVSNGTQTVTLSESSTGYYYYSDRNFITENATMTMSFEYNGKTISAQTIVPPKPINFVSSSYNQAVPDPDPTSTTTTTFIPVVFSWTMASNDNYLLVFANQDNTPNRIGSGFGRRDSYRDLEFYLGQVPSYSTSAMTFTFSGFYTTYLYRVNAEYNNIVNSSSTSSLNLTNPATNINNGLGIFTAMSVDSLVLNVYQE